MSADLRPRDRLLRHGPDTLSDVELVAVLLRNGNRGTSALEAAERLLRDVGGLVGLIAVDRKDLRHSAAGDGRAAVILAANALFRRITVRRVSRRELLDRPDAVAAYVAIHYQAARQETMGALYLDVRNRLIAGREIFRGTLAKATVEPAPIIWEALRHQAATFILWHTHPSGDPSPSPDDLLFTRRMSEAGELLGIKDGGSRHHRRRWALDVSAPARALVACSVSSAPTGSILLLRLLSVAGPGIGHRVAGTRPGRGCRMEVDPQMRTRLSLCQIRRAPGGFRPDIDALRPVRHCYEEQVARRWSGSAMRRLEREDREPSGQSRACDWSGLERVSGADESRGLERDGTSRSGCGCGMARATHLT